MIEDEDPSDYYPRRRKWLRGIIVLIVLVGYGFAEAVIWFLAFIQFFWALFKGEPNQHIQRFAVKLIKWTSMAISFCLCTNDLPPFPFSPWPDDR